jgi:hypothetical protein
MQQASDAACTIPEEEVLNKLVTELHLPKEQILSWYRVANDEGWPVAMHPSKKGVFCTGKVCSIKIADTIAEWTIHNAGRTEQGFDGGELNTINSSLRFVEFVDFFTTYTQSGSTSLDEERVVVDSNLGAAMKVLALTAEGLLSELRADQRELFLYRCFINVMDIDCASGAGKHCDLDASMGTVVVKLTAEDEIETALKVYETKTTQMGTPVTLPKGHGVAFLPMTPHMVPFKKRTVTRVTCNFFFRTTSRLSEAYPVLLPTRLSLTFSLILFYILCLRLSSSLPHSFFLFSFFHLISCMFLLL